MKSLPAVLIVLSVASLLRAEPETKSDPVVNLPTVEVSSTSLEIGAQFNPFTNSFTHTLKYVNVSRLKEGTVASRARLHNGDHIVAIAGFRLADYKISEFPDIKITAVNHQVTVPLKVQRKGEPGLLDLALILPDFEGDFTWSLRHSTLQKKAVPL